MPEPLRVLIAGAGIGGLAAALATARAGQRVQLFEKTSAFSAVGAGVQLGPNVTRILREWGLGSTLDRVACRPERLAVHDAASGALLASLPLGDAMVQRYGAPYVTVHRAALHGLLLDAVRQQPGVELQMGWTLQDTRQDELAVHTQWHTAEGKDPVRHADLLVSAEGVWSLPLDKTGLGGGLRFTQHWAYRCLLDAGPLTAGNVTGPLPALLKQVTLWLGPQMHVVAYPVRGAGGELLLNLVVLLENDERPPAGSWSQTPLATLPAIEGVAANTPLHGLLHRVDGFASGWQRWPLFALPPLSGPHGMANGRTARLGDAAHPMLPYLAQGAGMAIEDADALGRCLGHANHHPEDRLAQYAAMRWRRNARVQAGAARNARIFHANGLVRAGRDWALRRFGGALMEQAWLYDLPGKNGH